MHARTVCTLLALTTTAFAQGSDDCANATAWGPLFSFSTFGSTPSGEEPTNIPVTGHFMFLDCDDPEEMWNDIWYTYTPTTCGEFQFSLCNSTNYDSRIAVYSGTCGALVTLGCNDDGPACANFASEVDIPDLEAGETYYVQIGGASASATGDGTFHVFDGPPATCSLGSSYCGASQNSQSPLGSLLFANGSTSVSSNDLELVANHVEPGQPGIFFYGTAQIPLGVSFGEGQRCAAGNVVRVLPPVFADAGGKLTRSVDNQTPTIATSTAPLVAGATLHFQAWYRDPLCADCDGDLNATGFNLSSARTLTFTP